MILQNMSAQQTMRKFSICISWLILLWIPSIPAYPGTKELAITFDDLPAALVPGHADQLKTNQRILDVLDKYQIKATGFVISNEANGKTDILELWLKHGHDLGNHTYSHLDFDQVDISTYERDIIKGAYVIEKLLRDYKRRLTYFRFPYLHTGRNSEKGEEIRKFLKESCYTIAPVTIDPYDWEYNYQYVRAWRSNNKREQILSAYLGQIRIATAEAENLFWERFGRNIRQVLLVHLNRINAEVLDKIVEYYFTSGYSFISLEEALQDSAYSPEGELVKFENLTWQIKPDLGLFQKQLK